VEKQRNVPQLDVRSVIRTKSPALGRFLPGFTIRYLERILHQKEINHVLSLYGHLPGVEAAQALSCYFDVKITVHGLAQIPKDGRYLFVSNHPLGGFDGILLIKVIGEVFSNVKFIVNDLLLNLKLFDDVFVPVNKHGRQSREYAQGIRETYDSDAPIIYFPAGLCSRKIKGKITDLPWRRNVLQKAVKHRRDIVPVFFSGQNSNFFYRLANVRRRLRFPFNLEMLYLSDEMFRQKGASFDIYFGEPVSYNAFTPDKNADQWMSEIRNRAYSLPQQT